MDWTLSEVIALAKESCTRCAGFGLTRRRYGPKYELTEPCHCVLRAIFRACYARFRYCSLNPGHIGTTRLDAANKERARTYSWGRKDEEYCADFVLVGRRTLSGDEADIFELHYLLGAEWRYCCRKLGLDRGYFFHSVYRLQQKLGRVFRELEPYSLYPLDEYFGGVNHRSLAKAA